MSKTAVPSVPDNFTTKFLESLVNNYFELPDLWEKLFLTLSSNFDFKRKVVEKSLKECSKFRSDKATSIKRVWSEFFQDLPSFEQRIGQYIYKIIKTKVEENIEQIKNSDFGFSTEFNGNLLLEEREINKIFSNLNKEVLKKGEFINSEHQDLLPATLTIETQDESREINIKLMKSISKVFISHLPEIEKIGAAKFYEMMINGYKKWEINSQGNKNFIKRSKAVYKELKKELKGVFDSLPPSEVKEKLNKSIEKINNLSYKGASFPVFPGIIRKEALQYAPPTNLDLFQFIIPAFGMGWDSNKNLYFHFVSIIEQLSDLEKNCENFNDQLLSKINSLKKEIIKFFSQNYNVDMLVYSSTLMNEIYAVMDSPGKQKAVFQDICSNLKLSISGIKLFDIKFMKGNKNLEIETRNIFPKNKFHVFIITNNWGKESNFPWERGDINILPEIIFTLLANAGIYPSEIEIHTKKFNFELSNDDKWNYEKRILRIIKSLLDGVILKVLMDNTEFDSTIINENSFLNLKSKDQILFIPILNQFSSNFGKKTNIHRYYYEISETVSILSRIIHTKEFGSVEKYSSKKACLLHIQEKILSAVNDSKNLSNFVIQMFNQLPNPNNILDTAEIWKDVDDSKKEQVLKTYNQNFSQNFKFYDIYRLNNKKNKKSRVLKAGLYETKSTNRKIFPYRYIINRILRLRASDLPFSELINKIKNHNSDTFQSNINNFFEEPKTKKALSRSVGLYVKPGSLFPRLINTSSSIRRNFGLGLKLTLDTVKSKYSTLLAINIEGTTLNNAQFDENLQERIIRISVFQYSLLDKPKVIFDEFFYKNPTKDVDYEQVLKNTVIKTCTSTGIPIIIRDKNRSKSGNWLTQSTISDDFTNNALINNETWRDFIRLSKTKCISSEDVPCVGFIKNYIPIPYIKFKSSKSDVRVLKLVFNSQFCVENEKEEYESFIYLIFKGTDQKGSNLLYAHASALLCFAPKGETIKDTEENNIFELLLLSAALGDEKGKIGLSGLERLFVYPYTDVTRRIYSPALFLYGMESITYERKNEYEE